VTGLTISNIHKSYEDIKALAGVSLEVNQGEIVALLGPSGCGKSTLLNIIAGLETADDGFVLWNGTSLANIPPHRRNFGLMFQDFALFPHRNVYDNVAFGLQIAGMPKSEIESRVHEVLNLVDLSGFEQRDTNNLSGGESQRVALARSLAPRPRLLMLDEPLGSLDRNLREKLVFDLKRILQKSKQTALYVTHDQEEAFALANRIAVMNSGSVEQFDTPQNIYRQPATTFVAGFIGLRNLIPGEIRKGNGFVVITPIGVFPIPEIGSGPVKVLLRPDTVQLGKDGPCQISGKLIEKSFRGHNLRVVINVDDYPLFFEFPSNFNLPEEGDSIQLSFHPEEAIQVYYSKQ
jgi:ABC-type Fe3+/spermidine/putrescine transport system ATPase subunit